VVAALECYLDRDATRRIEALWDALEEAGIPSLRTLTHRRHRPHLSLATSDEFDPAAVAAALGGLPAAPPLRLEFEHVGQFVGRVLWLGPAPTQELLAHQAAVHQRLVLAGIVTSAHYHPGRWVPHCTVSMRVPRPMVSEGVRRCLEVLPIPATLAGAAVADHNRGIFHPLPDQVP
jgi:2'-5' RNA ligase